MNGFKVISRTEYAYFPEDEGRVTYLARTGVKQHRIVFRDGFRTVETK